MEKTISYLVAVHIYALLLLLIYRLCLRNQNANGWSRGYLWAAAVLPFVLPLLTLPRFVQQSAAYKDNISLVLPEVVFSGAAQQQTININMNVALLVYCLIASVLLLRMGWRLYRFYRLVRHTGYRQEGPYRIVCKEGIAPGSFMNYILLPTHDVAADIVRHEQAHIDQKHSYDIIVLQLVQCLGFFNLFLPLVRKELLLVHEFDADRLAATDKGAYATLLVQEGFYKHSSYTDHSFFTHPIKRRIMMLHKTSSLKGIRKIGVVVLLGSLCLAGIGLQSTTRAVAAPPLAVAEKEEPVFRTVEQAPAPGYDWSKYLQEHLETPSAAVGKQYDYRIYITFIVEKDGIISNVKSISARNGNEQLPTDEVLMTAFKESALKTVAGMPAWKPAQQGGKPVRCYYTVPVKFVSE